MQEDEKSSVMKKDTNNFLEAENASIQEKKTKTGAYECDERKESFCYAFS